jgi:hypothetical protein
MVVDVDTEAIRRARVGSFAAVCLTGTLLIIRRDTAIAIIACRQRRARRGSNQESG